MSLKELQREESEQQAKYKRQTRNIIIIAACAVVALLMALATVVWQAYKSMRGDLQLLEETARAFEDSQKLRPKHR